MPVGKPIVLIVGFDDLSRRLTAQGLEVYDYPVLVAANCSEAAAILRSGRRIGALVVDVDQTGGEFDGLALARLAREIDRRTGVVYTSRLPHTISEARKVADAPTLRIPFWPFQLTSVLADLRSDRSSASSLPRAA